MKNIYNVGEKINTNFNGIKNVKAGNKMQTFRNSIEQALENISKRIHR